MTRPDTGIERVRESCRTVFGSTWGLALFTRRCEVFFQRLDPTPHFRFFRNHPMCPHLPFIC